jgi:hypothetical protein
MQSGSRKSNPSRSASSRPIDDFNANDLVKEYGRSIGEHQVALDRLVERLGDDDKFAKTFEELARKDKRVDLAVSTILVDLIANNANVRTAITAAVNASDRRWWGVFGKRLGFAVWSLALVIATAIITAIVTHIAR